MTLTSPTNLRTLSLLQTMYGGDDSSRRINRDLVHHRKILPVQRRTFIMTSSIMSENSTAPKYL